MDVIQSRFRNVMSCKIGAWNRAMFGKWRFKRYRRAICHLQRRWRAFLMRRKFAAVEKQVAVLQAHIRRRLQQRKFRAYLKVKAKAGTMVQSFVAMAYHHRRYLRCKKGITSMQAIVRQVTSKARFVAMRRGFTRLQAVYRGRRSRRLVGQEVSALKIQSVFRGYRARKRVKRLRAIKLTGCVRIQANVRRFLCQTYYQRLQAATHHGQRLWRGKLARRLASLLRSSLGVIQNRLLGYVWRRRYVKAVRGYVEFQALYRGFKCRQRIHAERHAARRLEHFLCGYIELRKLADWTQELHAACSWGDAAEAEALLRMSDMTWSRLGAIATGDRASIRNRVDGMKSALHAAAASGDVATVELLLTKPFSTKADVVDLYGATPLHNACALGDSHLGVTRLLVASVSNRAAFLNRQNVAGETALDLVVLGHQASVGSMPGGGFQHTAAFLIASGASSVYIDEARSIAAAATNPSLRGNGGGSLVGEDQLLVAQVERREQEVLQRRKKERLSDPHYQFLFVAAQEKKRKAALAAERAARLERLRKLEAERLLVDRRRMQEEEEYSRRRAFRDREEDEARAERAAIARQAARDRELQRLALQQAAQRRAEEQAARQEAERAAAAVAAAEAAEAERAARLRREEETLERLARDRARRIKEQEEMVAHRAAEEERRRLERKRKRAEEEAAQQLAEANAARERAARAEQAKREREQRRLRRTSTEASPARATGAAGGHGLLLARTLATGDGVDASAPVNVTNAKAVTLRRNQAAGSPSHNNAPASLDMPAIGSAAETLTPPPGEPRAANNRHGGRNNANGNRPSQAGAAKPLSIASAWEELETDEGVVYFYNSVRRCWAGRCSTRRRITRV